MCLSVACLLLLRLSHATDFGSAFLGSELINGLTESSPLDYSNFTATFANGNPIAISDLVLRQLQCVNPGYGKSTSARDLSHD